MSNLLPFKEKKKLTREYTRRFFATIAFLIFLAFVISTIFLFPAYIFSRVRENIVEESLEFERQQAAKTGTLDVNAIIEDINKRLQLFSSKPTKDYWREKVLVPVLSAKVPGITITKISYARETKNGEVISLTGNASNRLRLTAFTDSLKQQGFSNINLPIQSFVKDKNLDFTIEIILKK